jgi:hypothetical protein
MHLAMGWPRLPDSPMESSLGPAVGPWARGAAVAACVGSLKQQAKGVRQAVRGTRHAPSQSPMAGWAVGGAMMRPSRRPPCRLMWLLASHC